jgi:cell filamentation protein
LRGNDSKGFCQRAAHYLGEINALHPLHQGNERAQREFIRELVVESGYELREPRYAGMNCANLVTRDEMFAASVVSFHGGSSEACSTILNKIIRPVR